MNKEERTITPKPPYSPKCRREMHKALDELLDMGFTTIIVAGKQAGGGYGYKYIGNKISIYGLCNKLQKKYMDGKL